MVSSARQSDTPAHKGYTCDCCHGLRRDVNVSAAQVTVKYVNEHRDTHRCDGPSNITIHRRSERCSIRWSNESKGIHRGDGPATTFYDGDMYWTIGGLNVVSVNPTGTPVVHL